MKKLFVSVIALVIVLSMSSCAKKADEVPVEQETTAYTSEDTSTAETDNVTDISFEYEFSDELEGIIIVSYTGDFAEVEIPSQIGGKPVKCIGDYSFSNCQSITEVTIPDSVTVIGENAFFGCYNLKSLIFPDSVQSIGKNAFDECSGLSAISLPDKITSIEDFQFRGCTSLTEIVIPESVTYIGNGAFDSCINLSHISLPDSITAIGENAFDGCRALKVTYKEKEYSYSDLSELYDAMND
ncbi:MAG: leucine-rich repeat domain-containing protein [Oscillospiraceae bacterium]